MVAIPVVAYGLLYIVWDRSGQVEWGGCVVYLTTSVFIKFLEVNGPSWLAIFLGTYDHTVAKVCESVGWDLSYPF